MNVLVCTFCSKTCKNPNSLRNHERLCPKNLSRVYVSQTLGKPSWNKGLTKEDPRVAAMATRQSERMKGCKGTPHSEETRKRLSQIQSELLSRNSNRYRRGRQSYLEKSFSEWLLEHKVDFESEVHFRDTSAAKSYYVDFLFEDRKLIIELDGNQHEKRKEQDAIRDKFLTSLGYTVVRISHKEFVSKSRVAEVQNLLGLCS